MERFAIVEEEVTLIGANDAEVAASEYSNSVSVSLKVGFAGGPSSASGSNTGRIHSGEILAATIVSYETGSGAVQEPAGVVFVFDTDPTISSGASTMSADGADALNIVGAWSVATTDWVGDSNGKVAHKALSIPFHGVDTLYFVWQSASGAGTINSAAGDDEIFQLKFWYRRDR